MAHEAIDYEDEILVDQQTRDRHGKTGQTKGTEPDVSTPSPEWFAMEPYRALPRDLAGGLLKFQKLRETRLWKAAREKRLDYERRVKALQFEPYYGASCELLGGQPFTREITFSEDTPPELLKWLDDIDLAARTARQVARSSCIDSVWYGHNVLWPRFDEERERPFVEVLPAASVLDPYVPGQPVRILRVDFERHPDRPWIKMPVEQIWIFYDGDILAQDDTKFARWDVYEREDRLNKESAWNKEPTDELGGLLRPLLTIPLFALYTGNLAPPGLVHDPWLTIPPLHPLAAANVVWINKRSDLDNGLHNGNIPQRVAKGITEDEVKKINKTSYTGIWWTEQVQGLFYFLEPSGGTFEISALDLADMERRMEVLGNMPNVTRADVRGRSGGGEKTAAGEEREARRATTVSQAMALGWQDTWQTVYRTMAEIMKLPAEFDVGFNTKFGPRERDIERWQSIQADHNAGYLSHLQYFELALTIGGYPETFKPKEAAAFATAKDASNARLLAAARAADERGRKASSQDQDEDDNDNPGEETQS